MALGSRCEVHVGVTRHPTDAWIAHQLREATPFDQRPGDLIRDNDSKCGRAFTTVAQAGGIAMSRTAYRGLKEHAICERFLGSVRRACLDHVLVLGEAHLRRILHEDVRCARQRTSAWAPSPSWAASNTLCASCVTPHG